MAARKHGWRAWGSCEEIRLEELLLEGKKLPEIARTLGRSYASVRYKCGQLECLRMRSVLRYLPVVSCVTTLAEQARAMNCSVNTLKAAKQALRRLGHDLPYLKRRNQYGECGTTAEPTCRAGRKVAR